MKKIAKIKIDGMTLARLEDNLLPKFMKGEARLKEVEKDL